MKAYPKTRMKMKMEINATMRTATWQQTVRRPEALTRWVFLPTGIRLESVELACFLMVRDRAGRKSWR